MRTVSYQDALLEAMNQGLDENPNAFIMGQGADDHKGLFGSTTGMVDKFGPERVFDTPLAEEGITGIAVGAAMNGMYPITTHIRSDFMLLATNQIINMAAKYRYMFGGTTEVPMLIRAIVGRSWGQGAQHSQSLQSLFAHIPGLHVIMPSSSETILDTYAYVMKNVKGPVISFEHRLLYTLNFEVDDQAVANQADPLRARLLRKGKDITIVSTSIMTLEASRAAKYLAEEAGIECELIDLHCLSKIDIDLICESVKKTGRLLIADTSWAPFGVCAEICRLVCERDPSLLKQKVESLSMAPAPCPTAKTLEDMYYPHLGDFCDTVSRLVKGSQDHGVKLPDEKSMADVYKRFRGPF
ncbi:Acetoin dehydrogenase E1 component beta-subunit [Candidatus Terasakiella magnetica]|uniref:Acetoin dehydrogenase E1 component beta-subunit n=1 Tax=Candidatus Terasakiella magnetica TaxID=1867952 RepID=A0A1C3RKJ1_9PROT|nr:transketolase C-terminal domain-containing protein [Candidatus Terasakiella magnetica]SCA57840.1 Acetoin dehydrogenase E1 component beta-subunit [Candidatus Terasakiella magnetica]